MHANRVSGESQSAGTVVGPALTLRVPHFVPRAAVMPIVLAGCGERRYTPTPMTRLKHFGILAAVVLVFAFGAGIVRAAPPGWELRNGSWVPVVQPNPDTPEGKVAEMIRELDSGETKHVIRDAREWVKDNKLHPLMPQVLLLQGDAEVARGNKYKALYSYEEMLLNYPTSDLYIPVLQREFNIADAFLNGYKRKFLGMRVLGVSEDALELLDRIQDRQRGSAIAEQAGMRIVDYYYSVGKFQEAGDSATDFLKRYPYSQYVRKAEIRRAQASLGSFRGVLFDFTPLYDARERLTAAAEAYPQSTQQLQIPAIDDRIYQLEGKKELEIARYYWRAGRRHAAAYYYKRVSAQLARHAVRPIRARRTGASHPRGGGQMKNFLSVRMVAGFSCVALALAGCGYSTKPPFNASIRTIAVPIFNNQTFRREWEFRLTEAIDKNIEYRTPYKIADRKNADTLLTGEIKQVQENVLTRRFGTDLPRENELTVVVDFTWKDLRSGRILVERKSFNRSATEIPQIGERVEDAEQLAIERLAAAIVDQLQSDWGTEPTTAPATRP